MREISPSAMTAEGEILHERHFQPKYMTINKTDDITEILLKVVLNTITLMPTNLLFSTHLLQ
jgi:hypothetical protein